MCVILVTATVTALLGCARHHLRREGADGGLLDAPSACARAAATVADVDAFFEAWTRAACTGAERCRAGRTWESVEACTREGPYFRDTPTNRLGALRDALRAAAARSEIAIDTTDAASCFARLGEGCYEPLAWKSCWRVIGAACPLDDGDACRHHLECGPDSRCQGSWSYVAGDASGVSERCDVAVGTCSPLLAPGSRCEDDEDACPGVCLDGVCRELGDDLEDRALGEACDFLSVASDGRATRHTCSERLTCGAGTCVPVLSRGSRCGDFESCERGSQCLSGLCSARETTGPGDPCQINSHGFCSAPFVVCGQEGESRCSGADGTRGRRCDATSPPCDLGMFCLVSTRGACLLADGTRGAACDGEHGCLPGLACADDGRCGDLRADGERCFEHRACASGSCSLESGCCP